MAPVIPSLIGATASSEAIREALADHFDVTSADRAGMRGKHKAFDNEVAFAIVKCLREGTLVKPDPRKFEYRAAH